MTEFGFNSGIVKSTSVSKLELDLEHFRLEVFYRVLKKKGYSVTMEAASTHVHKNSLEDAAKNLKKILPPPVIRDPRKKSSGLIWALVFLGILLFISLFGVTLNFFAPEIADPIFSFIKSYALKYYVFLNEWILSFINT